MNINKVHIIYKGIVILLITSFLVPSIVKFAHAFENLINYIIEFEEENYLENELSEYNK